MQLPSPSELGTRSSCKWMVRNTWKEEVLGTFGFHARIRLLRYVGKPGTA